MIVLSISTIQESSVWRLKKKITPRTSDYSDHHWTILHLINLRNDNDIDYDHYPLVNAYLTMVNYHAIRGKLTISRPCSTAILNYTESLTQLYEYHDNHWTILH